MHVEQYFILDATPTIQCTFKLFNEFSNCKNELLVLRYISHRQMLHSPTGVGANSIKTVSDYRAQTNHEHLAYASHRLHQARLRAHHTSVASGILAIHNNLLLQHQPEGKA